MKFHQFKIRFVENKKIFFGISIAVLLIGVIFNVIFGARLDIQFTGGAIVNYSFTGEINTDELAALVEETTGKSVNVNESTDIVAGEDGTINNNVSIELPATTPCPWRAKRLWRTRFRKNIRITAFKSWSLTRLTRSTGKSSC